MAMIRTNGPENQPLKSGGTAAIACRQVGRKIPREIVKDRNFMRGALPTDRRSPESSQRLGPVRRQVLQDERYYR